MELKSDERGAALILEIMLVVVTLAVVGFTIYKTHTSKSSKISSSSPTASSGSTSSSIGVDSACLAIYHDNDLCRFASHSTDLSKQSYQSIITSTQGGQTSTITFKNDGKGDTSLSSNLNGATFNSVELTGATYVESGGSWIKYPSSSAPTTSNPTSSMNISVDASGITYKKIGPVSCGSLKCFEYQINYNATPTTTQYVWFDNSAYKLHEWMSSDASGNTIDMKITYENVTISAPSPVKTLGQ